MLINFRLRLMFLFLVMMCICGVIFILYQRSDIRLCFVDAHPMEPNDTDSLYKLGIERLEDILQAKVQPKRGKSIFFHETSCPRISSNNAECADTMDWNMVHLNARQACAVESAALHNPNSQIFVLFASPRYKSTNKTVGSKTGPKALLEAILSYENVYLRNLNLWTYAANTPIYDWLKDGILFKSR